MNNYSFLLALAYFKEKQQAYIISELMEMLGYNRTQVSELVSELIEKGYIVYVDNLISISGKGVTFLVSHNQAEMVLQTDEIRPSRIKPETAISLEAPYVPIEFTKKYSG